MRLDTHPIEAFSPVVNTVACALLLILFTAALVFLPCSLNAAEDRRIPDEDELLEQLPETLAFATRQYQFLLESLKGQTNLPRTFVDGELKLVRVKDWTSGFFPGSLWYLYEYTDRPPWKRLAQEYTARLEIIKNHTRSHDVGFMLNCSYGNGYRLTGDPHYREVLIQGAHTLSTRFHPDVNLMRSWDHGKWQYPVIIDNMMNLELLMWVSGETGDARLQEIALSHADHTLKHHFRSDASSWHVVDFNPTNGLVVQKKTHQGTADSSAWARGQAWALYGYTMMYRETRRPAYLAQAERIARFLMNHPRLPEDKVPYWDFDAPDIPDAPRDASAAAIMASSLIELSQYAEMKLGQQCLDLARQQLLSLSSPAYLAEHGENGGFLLQHCVGHFPKNSEVDVPIIYGDYYFLEALLRYRAQRQSIKSGEADRAATNPSPTAVASRLATVIRAAPSNREQEVTPLSLPGSEPFVFRRVEGVELRLHVVKPADWSSEHRRPCLVSFFGGGWNSGTPERSIGWAKWAARRGLVGIAPDYRTRDRLGGTPEDCVSDGRAAVRWIEKHADELGIDPERIISLGSSAGGHVAAWTAIPSPGRGSDDPAPGILPAALVLVNPVTDTKDGGYGGTKRFGNDPARAMACSVPDQMPARMPPTLVFHGTADKSVPYANSLAFRDALTATGNRCELVTFDGMGHSFYSSKYGEAGKVAKQETYEAVATFLASLGLMDEDETAVPR